MSEDIIVDYKLTGTGWSECKLSIHGQTCTVTASYLSDALRELIGGVNHILSGCNETKFSFDEEPGEYRWLLRRLDDGAVSVLILWFPELWGDAPDADGKAIFEATCQIRAFAQTLSTSLDGLLAEHGLEGYKDKWVEADFPLAEFRALCALLDGDQT